MDNDHIILMSVLKCHYKDRPELLDEALIELKMYSNSQNTTQQEYDKISATLRKMLIDLPEDILLYFLSLVPMPKSRDSFSPNTHQIKDIGNMLTEYLNKMQNTGKQCTKQDLKDAEKARVEKISDNEYMFKKTLMSVRKTPLRAKRRITNKVCKKLTDICAEYIMRNKDTLKQDYELLKENAWKLINSDKYTGFDLDGLYSFLGDLNKKIEWIRLLEDDEIDDDMIRQAYFDPEIVFREHHLDHILNENPFKTGDELRNILMKFFEK